MSIVASDESEPLSYSATGLPTGVSIDESTGAISGVPTAAGTYEVTVTVEDSAGKLDQGRVHHHRQPEGDADPDADADADADPDPDPDADADADPDADARVHAFCSLHPAGRALHERSDLVHQV